MKKLRASNRNKAMAGLSAIALQENIEYQKQRLFVPSSDEEDKYNSDGELVTPRKKLKKSVEMPRVSVETS